MARHSMNGHHEAVLVLVHDVGARQSGFGEKSGVIRDDVSPGVNVQLLQIVATNRIDSPVRFGALASGLVSFRATFRLDFVKDFPPSSA